MSSADAFLLGRRTYEEWAGYWHGQSADENPMAAVINGLPNYVVSTTLNEVTWQNSTLLGADFASEVSKLKQRPGKDISISGSATLVRSLLHEGLLDELRLMIHPSCSAAASASSRAEPRRRLSSLLLRRPLALAFST